MGVSCLQLVDFLCSQTAQCSQDRDVTSAKPVGKNPSSEPMACQAPPRCLWLWLDVAYFLLSSLLGSWTSGDRGQQIKGPLGA